MANRNREYIDFLKQRFDETKFIEFISDLLNLSSEDINSSMSELKPEQKQFIDTIEYYKFIANYTSNSDKIGVFIVKLTSEGSQNARTAQRTFISTLLNKYDLDASLVAFYQDAEPSWRLSFVKKELNFTDKGIKVDLTPAKRFSYLVGENESVHTAQEYLFSLLNIEDRKITLDDIEKVFDVEKVTKKFFEEYKEKYLGLKEFLDKNQDFITESENCDFTSEEFAKKLMGQIVFLYFLQKKGWLGVQIVPDIMSAVEYEELSNQVDSVSNNLLEKYYIKEDGIYKIDRLSLKNESIKDNINNFVSIFKGTKYEKAWGTGDKQFVRNMFKKSRLDHKDNFFDEYLEPFFYSGLNEKRDNQYFILFNCKIPFLNGGLFEPLNNYRWSSAQFNIPDEMFSNDKKDGILDIFDLYNFTIDEEEPLEKDIAVDPEMLGKIFENLLDVKDRKSTGAFYTPREIVHYMCQETLANFIANKLQIPYDDIINFIKYGDVITQTDWSSIYNGNDVHLLPSSIWNRLIEIDKALINVKIADPAVGSGAFPLGLLNEIVKLRDNISSYILIQEDQNIISREDLPLEQKNRDYYSMKLQTIQNCIYAVDIEMSAVDIAKLRLWLSLIVDYPNEKEPKPLPNLDCKIMQGNSLLDEYEGIPLFSERELSNNLKNYKRNVSSNTTVRDILIQQTLSFSEDDDAINYDNLLSVMLEKQKEYFITSDSKVKKELKEKIENIQISLVQHSLKKDKKKLEKFNVISKKKCKPWFIWKLEFFDVFKNNGGFDIVIGNPPYVGQKGNSELFKPFKNSNYWDWFYERKQDLYYYFIVKGIMIGNRDSQLSYIIPPYFSTALAAQGLRKFIAKNKNVDKVVKFNGKVFNSASIDSLIMFLNGEPNSEYINISELNNSSDLNNIAYLKSKFSTKDLSSDEWYIFKDKDTVEISVENTINLGSIATISPGVQTGADHVSESHINKYNLNVSLYKKNSGIYILNEEEYNSFAFTEEEKKYIKPCYKSSDIEKYWTNNRNKYYLIITNKINDIDKLPNIKKHLEKYRVILDGRNRNFALKKAYDSGMWWYLNAFRPNTNFEGEKIVTPYRNEKIKFSYSDYPFYGSIDVFYINVNDKHYNILYILGILNSKLMSYWLKNNCKMKGNVIEFYQQPLSHIPIAIVSNENMEKIIKITKAIVEKQQQEKDYSKLQMKLDKLVFKIYNIKNDEILLIEELCKN